MKDLYTKLVLISLVLAIIGYVVFSHSVEVGYRQHETWNDPEYYWLIAPFFIVLAIGWLVDKFKK
jgi:hypothetical protein